MTTFSLGILARDCISPSAAAAADLTSGLSSISAFSTSLAALASLGTRPKTRIAVARLLVLSPVHAFWSICQACSFGVRGALARDGGGCPASFACGCVADRCGGSLNGGAFGLGCCCAGTIGCAAGGVDCCCADSRHQAIRT